MQFVLVHVLKGSGVKIRRDKVMKYLDTVRTLTSLSFEFVQHPSTQ